MREIRFRVWRNKAMFYNWGGWEDVDILHISELLEAFDCKLMQFTGLLDKNGKEIYEGDILIVDWGGIQDKYILDNKYEKPFVMEWRCYSYPPFSRYLPMPKDIEVLGNIYENRELLEDKDAS